MSKVQSDKFIDIDRILREKNPKLAKYLPRFIKSYIKRKVHQKDINQFINDHPNHYGVDFCQAVMEHFNITLKVYGLDNVPESGGVVFACNHPLGGMDALAIVSQIKSKRTDIKFIVNDILLGLKNLEGMFVGVNKHGATNKSALTLVDNLFASDQATFVFPAGLVSRRTKGIVEDLEWKKTFITRAKKHKRDIIPVYIDGELSNFFYRLSNFRKFIGIKANIEMLFLADELYKQKNQTMSIVIGKSIPYTTFYASKNDKKWAQSVKETVYSQKQVIEQGE